MKLTKAVSKNFYDVLKRWEQVKVPISIEDKLAFIHPVYLSSLVKATKSETLSQINGVQTKKEPESEAASCLRMCVHMGNDKRGSYIAYRGVDDLPEEVGLLKTEADEKMDILMKVGASGYLDGVGEAIHSTHSTKLMPNGCSIKIVYSQPSVKVPSTSDFEKDVLAFARGLQAVRNVREVSTHINVRQESSLFVDSIGSNILQHHYLLTFLFEISGTHCSGREIELLEPLYFSNREKYNPKNIEKRLTKLITAFRSLHNSAHMNSGSYPTLLDGSTVGSFIHEALAAHLLSGKYIADNDTLVFSTGRLGQRILPEYLTIVDDPTYEKGIGSYEYDEEGVKSKRVVLVKDGILKNYLLDKSSAARLGSKLGRTLFSNGHARSEWATDEDGVVKPEPRGSNLFVKSSNILSEGELWENFYKIIRDTPNTKYGLFVEGGGGEVSIDNGQFTLEPARVWRVDSRGNRRMVERINLIGDSDNLLNMIVAIGMPYHSSYGVCGASSGWVPTQERAPSLLISRVTAVETREDTQTKRLLPRMGYR